MNNNYILCEMKQFYGYKFKDFECNYEEKTAIGVLYDSFVIVGRIDDYPYDKYCGFGIRLCDDHIVTNVLGHSLLVNKNIEDIHASLKAIDDYCIARLPQKFLDEYNKAYCSDDANNSGLS